MRRRGRRRARAAGGAGNLKVELAYDSQGRRVAKRVYNWSGGQWVADPLEERRFVWHEWLMLEELGDPSGTGQGGTGFQPVRQHTWGLDLAGQNRHSAPSPFQGEGWGEGRIQAAGGIGGLLAVHQAALDRPGAINDVAAGDYGFTYDGNGNVVQVVNVSDYGCGNFHWQAVRTMAVYEYDAYGNVIGPDTNGDGQFDELDNVGPYAAENAMRFSTKYFDRETGLGYWGYRYYSPALGRWVSRDPIEERAGLGLYSYVLNAPASGVDVLGRYPFGGFPQENPHPHHPPGGKRSPAGGGEAPPKRLGLPPHVPESYSQGDRLDLWCYTIPQGSSFGGSHCSLVCNGQRIDGTGPSSTDRNAGGNGDPGVKVGTEDDYLPGDSKHSGGRFYPRGTCDCIKRAKDKLNAVPRKYYGFTQSNSNSALHCVMQACGVGLSPYRGGTRWNTPIDYDCYSCIGPGGSGAVSCQTVNCATLLTDVHRVRSLDELWGGKACCQPVGLGANEGERHR